MLLVKEKALNETQLENAAHQYMAAMGYKNVPYIVYFHNDTDNNHVHVVGTRVGQDGRKINSAFEKQRILGVMKDISKQFGFSIPKDFEVAKNLAFKFKFSSEAQFNLLMERQGFKVIADTNGYDYMQNGKRAGRVEKNIISNITIDPKLKVQDSDSRIKQIKALIYKYAPEYSPVVKISNDKLPGQRDKIGGENSKGKFHSDLSDFLKEKFGIEIIYHGSIEKGKPYGYSLIDNTSQSIFKGSEILSLQKLTGAEQSQPVATDIEKSIYSESKKNGIYNEREGISVAAEGESNQPTGYQWLEELDNLFKEMTFFAGDGGEESTPTNKKKRKNSQDLDSER